MSYNRWMPGQYYNGGELYHYGVLGMKWGVRKKELSVSSPAIERGKYAEYPKGTIVGRFGEYDPNYPMYLFTNKTDRDVYSKRIGGEEHSFTITKKIKRPSYEEQIKQLYQYTKDQRVLDNPYEYWKETINQLGNTAEGYFKHMRSLGYSALLDVRNYGMTEDPILLIDNSAVAKRK